MTPKPRYRRTHPDHQPPRTAKPPTPEPGGPVVVPVVEFTITGDGAMTVTVDGVAYLPEPFAPAGGATRSRQSSTPHRPVPVAAAGAGARGIRVDVHRHHHPTPRRPTLNPWEEPAPALAAVVSPPVRAAQPVLHQATGSGFVPGEDVAVAIIHAHTDASGDGTARTLLTTEQAALAVTGEVILLGRVSGTLTIGRIQ
ncbi:hypothetical protein [Microbacterium sp. CH12i]|uniref:hypothetical protein n=1 Tax=Microbacterium sp. CH12i TaxID=1479651 RepID=UPI0006907776|nr:hypothetical protein [Microbacterium sp. CH12i]